MENIKNNGEERTIEIIQSEQEKKKTAKIRQEFRNL